MGVLEDASARLEEASVEVAAVDMSQEQAAIAEFLSSVAHVLDNLAAAIEHVGTVARGGSLGGEPPADAEPMPVEPEDGVDAGGDASGGEPAPA